MNATDLFARFAPTVDRIRALCPKQVSARGWTWRPLWLDAEHAVSDGADDLSFGDDFDAVCVKVAERLAAIEATARDQAALRHRRRKYPRDRLTS